ncbi:hypothetical protein HPB48_011175 [Haemaphysalis longicornis]|uniref:Uncharacterized protein n=1 Tax=Haemaphysalis longicornis TaxID=44386 RepID=A0A9J6GI97_HAELO|nr:hypothetical protein HPB48_011175 [Haemaphysalis longicornis]
MCNEFEANCKANSVRLSSTRQFGEINLIGSHNLPNLFKIPSFMFTFIRKMTSSFHFVYPSIRPPLQQLRGEQVNQGGVQATAGSDQRRDLEPARPAAPAVVHAPAALPATTHGAGLRIRTKGELLPAQ